MFQRRVQQYLSRPWSVHRESARARGEINLARDKQSVNRHRRNRLLMRMILRSLFFRFAIFEEGKKNFFAKQAKQ